MNQLLLFVILLLPVSTNTMFLAKALRANGFIQRNQRGTKTLAWQAPQKKKWTPSQHKLNRVEMIHQLSAVPLDDVIKKRILRMIKDHETPQSALDLIFSLPWGNTTHNTFDSTTARAILDRDHYGMTQTKEYVLDLLAMYKLSVGSSLYNPIWCLVGAPGIGKTAICKSIAECMGRACVKISMGGARDESIIRGWPASYKSATAGRIVHELIHAKSMNPVIVLDEIDKVGKGSEGDNLSSALLELLDPEQRSAFVDHYLTIPMDLSQVTFIATANYPEQLAEPLKDRMEMICIPGYGLQEKALIARKHLMPKILKTTGMSRYPLELSDDTLNYLIQNYCPEQGVRRLEQSLRRIIAAHARHVLEHKKSLACTPETITKLLGKRPNQGDSVYIW